eukprot:6470455-Amphidinium_carterae.2
MDAWVLHSLVVACQQAMSAWSRSGAQAAVATLIAVQPASIFIFRVTRRDSHQSECVAATKKETCK